MAGAQFEIGAAFIVEDRATSVLTEIGRAFEALAEQATGLQTQLETLGERAFTGLKASVDAAATEVDRLIAQAGELGRAWETAGLGASGAGGRGGREGPGGGAGGGRGPGRDGLAEDRRNAEWENANQNQIYNRQYALAQRENVDRDIAARLATNDELAIPRPPRTGVSEYNYARGPLPPRLDVGGSADPEEAAVAGGAASRMFRHSEAGGVLRGMMPLLGGVTAYEAEKSAMTEERALTQALIEMGFKPGDPGFSAALSGLQRQVVQGTEGTIYSESKGANVLPGNAGQFGAVFADPQTRLENYEKALPTMLRFAEVAEQYHRGSIQESLKAAVSFAHMTHRYEAEPLGEGLNHLMALSLATGETTAGEQGILKYSVPLGMASGLGADETAAMTGFFQILGFAGTTAATGLGQMLMGLTQTGGPLAAQQHQTERNLSREFESSLKLDPKTLHEVRKSRGNQHVEAMEALGLFDHQGHVAADVAPGGKLNRNAFLRHIEEYLSSHDPMTDLSTLRNAFTVRGSREAAMLQDPGVIDRLNNFLGMMEHPPSVSGMQSDLMQGTLMQFEQMLANIANIGNTLAKTTLPGLDAAFISINDNLRDFNGWLRNNPLAASLGGWGLAIGGAAAALGVFGLAMRGVGTGLSVLIPGLQLFSSAGVGVAATEAASGLAALTAPMVGLIAALSIGGYVAGDWAKKHLPESMTGASAAQADLDYRASHGGMPRWSAAPGYGADPEHHLGGAPPQSNYGRDPEHHLGTSPATAFTITIQNTINGVTDLAEVVKNVTAAMTKAIGAALTRTTSDGHGSTELSPYNLGGGGW